MLFLIFCHPFIPLQYRRIYLYPGSNIADRTSGVFLTLFDLRFDTSTTIIPFIPGGSRSI